MNIFSGGPKVTICYCTLIFASHFLIWDNLLNYEDAYVGYDWQLVLNINCYSSLYFTKCFHIHALISFIIILLDRYHYYYHYFHSICKKKGRLREVNLFVLGHTAMKWRSHIFCPSLPLMSALYWHAIPYITQGSMTIKKI